MVNRSWHVPLRPAIAAAAVVVTAVSLLGGILLYQKASDALNSALDTAELDAYSQLSQAVAHGKANVESGKVQAHASLGRATAQGNTNMEQVMSQAHSSLVASVDDGSNADIRLFASELRLTFEAAEEQVVKIQESVLQLAPMYTTLEDFSERTVRDMCGMLLGVQQKGMFRVTGAGATLWHGERDKQLHPVHGRFGAGFCWWDYPGGHHVFTNEQGAGVHWYVQKEVEWRDDTYVYDSDEGDTVPGEPDFVAPMFPIEFDSNGLMSVGGEEIGTELVSVHWDVANAYHGTKNWSAPQTWWIAPENYYYDESVREEGVALYMTYQQTTKMPDVGPFAGMLVQSEAEVDLGVWKSVIHDFVQARKPKGMFMVVNDLYELCFAHSTEPAPDMASTEACSNGESAGLSQADSSACFPQVWNYSATSQFMFRELRNQPYNTLVTGTYRVPATATYAAYYLRKRHLQTLGEGFNLDVMWAMPSADVQGELDTQRAQAEAALQALIADETEQEEAFARRAEAGLASMEATMQGNTSEHISRLRNDTQGDINAALVLMVVFCAAAFVVNCTVSAGWIVLLANPLREVAKCVVMMGQMHIDEAIQRDLAAGPSRVAEVHRLRSGFSMSARFLAEYRNYLPQSVLRDCTEGDDDTKVDKEEASLVATALSSRHTSRATTKVRAGVTSTIVSSQQSAVVKKQALATQLGTKMKAVGIAVFNCKQFHAVVAKGTSKAVEQHAKYISIVISSARNTKGICESFEGDRMFAHFNAATQCGNYRANVCTTVVTVLHGTRQDSALAVVCGASSGKCAVGNMGVDGMRKFAVIGQPAAAAVVMCYMANAFGVHALVPEGMRRDTDSQFMYVARGRVSAPKLALPQSSQSVFSVYHLLDSRSSASEDEWMYQLEDQGKSDPNKEFNDAFDTLVRQKDADQSESKAVLKKSMQEKPEDMVWLSSLIQCDAPSSWTDNGPSLAEGL